MHKFIGLILDIKNKNNLIQIQKALVQVSKQFKKDDCYYITGCDTQMAYNQIDPYILNYHYIPRIPKELDLVYDFSKNFSQFEVNYFIINDYEYAHYHVNSIKAKVKKMRSLGVATIFSTHEFVEDTIINENFDQLEVRLKEIYGTHQNTRTIHDEIRD